MSDGPKLHLKCLTSNRSWWTAGKLYPVGNGRVVSDDSGDWGSLGLSDWSASGLEKTNNGGIGKFAFVWLLPDGTELEALP